MPSINTAKDPVVLSYAALRRAVGYVAFSLPIAVYLGAAAIAEFYHLPTPWLHLGSISAYYYTGMGRFFVGSLAAVGVFMFSNRGYDLGDEIAGLLAALCAFGVANFPTTPDVGCPTPHQQHMGYIHAGCATALFLTLATFCLCLFPKTSPNGPTPEKKKRNVIYYTCGATILVCITAIALHWLIKPWGTFYCHHGMLFWFETISLFAFGTAWMVKGETIFRDKSPSTSHTRTTSKLLTLTHT